MNRLFHEMWSKHMPKLNPEIMNGLATLYLPKSEEYIDKVMRSAFHGLIDGLEYLGYERCSPQEEYEVSTRQKNNKRTYDLAKSYIYLVKYKLAFKGEPLPYQYIFLPYVDDAGIIRIGGAMFHITPVLSDKVISPGPKSIFVRLLQYKLNFYRTGYSIAVNGVSEAVQVVWSVIYNQPKENRKVPQTTKALTCLAHYLFAKFGVTETFRRYTGVVPIFGTSKDVNIDNYHPDAWIIVDSAHQQHKPLGYIGEYYEGTKIRVAIPKASWNSVTQSFVSSFFYVVDHFPEQMLVAYIDNTQQWKLLLGYILFSSHYTSGNLATKINEHFVSLDTYVDNIAIEKLAEKGYRIENFYDLLALLTTQYTELAAENSQANSMYGKYLDVLYYVMLPITTSIFTTKFALMKMTQKSPPQFANIKDTFTRKLKPGPIFKLSSDNPVTETVSYSGDHKFFKLTSKVTQQESGPAGRRGRARRKVVGEDEYLNASMIEGGSLLFLAKSNPRPSNRINPYVKMDMATGTILPNPALSELLARTDYKLSQK